MLGKCQCKQVKEAHVHVIYTGGTIGMMRNEAGALAPIKGELHKRLRDYPNCHDKHHRANIESNGKPPLVLPAIEGTPYRVVYDLSEYSPLLDSSCMNMNDWRRIATDIGENYSRYDGFVILHGTDTMAYTASALAFMLQNLGKPVVVTGAQIPIFEMRTDGRDNFIGSLILAGNYDIPEVMLYFDNKVLRGCRTTKVSSESFNAFDSPNQPPIGTIGIKIDINSRQIFRPCNLGKFSVHTNLEPNVGLLRIYPGITAEVLNAFFNEPMRGVVIQSFGSGNIPINQPELLKALRDAVERGLLIVNITQCSSGSVAPIYEAGAWMDMGVVAGCDMTQEAAFAKLAYVLSKKEWDLANKKKVMLLSIRGELTTNKLAKINDIDLVEGVARTLHLSSCKERDQMCSTFFPAIVEAAVRQDDAEKLKVLRQYGANLCDTNSEGRSALHLACYMSKQNCVDYLLDTGCSVELTDRFNRTPLHEAIDTDNHKLIKYLLRKGAVLNEEPAVQAEQLRSLVEQSKIDRLESYRLAGANLTVPDPTGRTSLHYACHLGKKDVVTYLLPYYSNPSVKDELGLGPIHYAKAAKYEDIVSLLCASKNQ